MSHSQTFLINNIFIDQSSREDPPYIIDPLQIGSFLSFPFQIRPLFLFIYYREDPSSSFINLREDLSYLSFIDRTTSLSYLSIIERTPLCLIIHYREDPSLSYLSFAERIPPFLIYPSQRGSLLILFILYREDPSYFICPLQIGPSLSYLSFTDRTLRHLIYPLERGYLPIILIRSFISLLAFTVYFYFHLFDY